MTDRLDFDEYVTVHGRALERYAYVLTGQVQSAQDLVQTALMKSYRRWRRISCVEHPDAYVRRIVTNCYLDQRRRRSNTEQPMAEATVAIRGAIRSNGAAQADPAVGVANRDELIRALDRLSPQQRAVIVLRHFLGLDDAAIAGELGCSQATVRSHATRGLQRMRLALGDPQSEVTSGSEDTSGAAPSHGSASTPASIARSEPRGPTPPGRCQRGAQDE